MAEKHDGKRTRLARALGFCSGVKAAIDAVEKALKEGPLPVCVLHEIVHNERVVESLAKRGVRFIEKPEDAPSGSTLVFSAHGVSKAVEDLARSLPLRVVDATCPLVKSLQRKAADYEAQGFELILVGDPKHSEMIGVLGRLKKAARVVSSEKDVEALGPFSGKCACLTQTTLSDSIVAKVVEKLKAKRPGLLAGGGVCYATRDRQSAVKELAKACDAVLVLGSERSSNSRRLKEVAEAAGAKAFLIASAENLPESALRDVKNVGVTAGASAPGVLVEELLARLEELGFARP